jgi:hypothetical protein
MNLRKDYGVLLGRFCSGYLEILERLYIKNQIQKDVSLFGESLGKY